MSLVPPRSFPRLARNDRANCSYGKSSLQRDQSFAESFRSRDDGFHEIETLIAPISLYDEIQNRSSVPATRNRRFGAMIRRCRKAEDNIVVRAAKHLFSKKRRSPAVSRSCSKGNSTRRRSYGGGTRRRLPLCWPPTNCSREFAP